MLHLRVRGLSWLMWHAAHWQLCFPIISPFFVSREIVSWCIHEDAFAFRPGDDAATPVRITKQLRKTQNDSGPQFFRKQMILPSELALWPWFASVLPGTLLTRRCSQGEEHAHLASSSTISPPRFLLSASSRRSSDWRHRNTACGDQVRRLPSFAIPRCEGTAACAALSPPFVCTHRFHSNTHCAAVGPCNGAQRLRLCLHYLWVFAGPRRLSKHISQSENI